MFKWMKQPIASAENFNPADYTFEGNGQLLAFQEAFEDISKINDMFAEANAKGVTLYAETWHSKGEKAAMEAANAFAQGPVMEGVIGDAWESIKKAFKKLWEKIKAFFHSAIQYFDAFFKSAKSFAEKYEEELKDKELDKFKFKMHRWNMDKFKSIDWKKVSDEAEKAGKAKGVVIESYGGLNGWVGVITDILMERLVVNNSSKKFTELSGSYKSDELADGWSEAHPSSDESNLQGMGFTKVLWKDAVKQSGGTGGGSGDSSGDSSEDTASSVEKITSTQKKEVERALITALGFGSTKGSIEQFKKELAKELRGGMEPREQEPKIDDIISYLKDNEDLDNIKDWEDTMNDSFSDMEDTLNVSEKKDDEKVKAKNKLAVFTIGKNVAMAMFNVYTAAIKERESEYKSCLSAALHYDAPKD